MADFLATDLFDAGDYNAAPSATGGLVAVPESRARPLLAAAAGVFVDRLRRRDNRAG